MKFILFIWPVFLLMLIGCNGNQLQKTSIIKSKQNVNNTNVIPHPPNKTKEGINMVSKKENKKRGCSGYYFFIQDHLAKLQRANTPYTGSSASADFIKEWEALTPEEREEYNQRATSK